MYVPQGYRYALRLTVTNPSTTATMGGSTTTPVPATSTDYVVQLHLTGALANHVFTNHNSHVAAFGDVTIFYGSTQLDIDYDTTSFGAWSANNICLWFKLQAPISAGAIDNNYLLAYGSVSSSPTVLRNPDNIYPFQDTFAGTTLSGKWAAAVGSTAAVNNGLTLSTTSGYGYLQSASATFGAGYRLSLYGTLPQPTTPGSLKGNGLSSRSGAGSPFAEVYTSNNVVGVAQKNAGTAVAATISGSPDGNTHLFEVWRDPASTPTAGLAHGWRDSATAPVGTGQESTGALPVQLFVWNSAGDGQTVQLTAQWVKVRYWIGVEATVSAGYAYVPVGYTYAQRLAVTNPSASVAMGGSTTTPSNGTDVVVQVHLSPDDARDILNLSSFKATDFSDVTLWYVSAQGLTQIDIDDDTTSFGPWNSTNGVTLAFKLQDTIPAGGTDNNYLLAWGNSSPTVLRNLDNIYPFQDNFVNAGGLSGKWTRTGGNTPTFDGNGIHFSTTSGYAYIQSASATFGAGYRLSMYGTLPQPTTPSTSKGNGLIGRSGAGSPFAEVYTSNNVVGVAENNTATVTATISGVPDGNSHTFEVARDAHSTPAAGRASGWRDGSQATVAGGQESTGALPVQLFVWNGTADGQTVSLSAQFVKVRPWIGVDATAALSSWITAPGYPRLANVLGLNNAGGQATTMERYALVVADQKLWVPATGQPLIGGVRSARPSGYRDLALLIYQASEEVDFNATTGALSANQPSIYDVGANNWWLFYSISATLHATINAGATSLTLDSNGSNPAYLFNDGGPLIRIDNETLLVTAGIGTSSLTVVRGALGTTAASHTAGATVKQHVSKSGSVFSSAQFNITSTLTNGANQTPMQYLAQFIQDRLNGLVGVDGVFLDNVNPIPSFVKHYDHIDIGTTWSGTPATYPALTKAWGAAQKSLQDTLRAAFPLLTIIGNGAVYPASSGREIEHFPYFDPFLGSSPPPTAPAFLASGIYPAYLQMTRGANPASIVNPDTAPLDDSNFPGAAQISLQQMRLDLGLALLGVGYYSYDGGGGDHGTPWWFDEYDQGADSSLTVQAPQSPANHITVAMTNGASYSANDQLYIPNDGGNNLNYDEAVTVQSVGMGGDLTLTANIMQAHRTWQKVLRALSYPKNLGWLGMPLEAPVSLTPPTGNLTQDWDFGTFSGGQFTYWPLNFVLGTQARGTVTTDVGPNGGSDQCARITVTAVDNSINAFNLYVLQGGLALVANTTYTLTFWAKTTSPYGFPLVVVLLDSSGTLVRQTYTLGTTWQMYTLAYTTGSSGTTASIKFALASNTSDATGDIFLDKVTLQQGDPNVWKREFEQGMVVVNATGQTQTALALPSAGTGHSWSRINGTQDHTTNNGAGSQTSITIQPGDAVLFIRM